ncbi:anti-sigma factor [Microbacterium aureliae]
MSHLDPEQIALVALGEPASDADTAHLAACPECALELSELRRTVLVGKSTVGMGGLEAPPQRVWDRIAAEIAAPTVPVDDRRMPVTAVPGSPVAAPTAADAAPAAAGNRAAPRGGGAGPRLSRLMLALAASAAVVLAVVGTWALIRPAQVVQVASANLAAFPDHPGAEGSAVVVEGEDGEKVVRVELEDDEAGTGYREVWLITADATAIVSLGILEGTEGEFAVPEDVDIRDYVLVDISQEPEDGDPTHSGDSIVRGELDFA